MYVFCTIGRIWRIWWIHPFLEIILVQFILFFKLSYRAKQLALLRNFNKFCPPNSSDDLSLLSVLFIFFYDLPPWPGRRRGRSYRPPACPGRSSRQVPQTVGSRPCRPHSSRLFPIWTLFMLWSEFICFIHEYNVLYRVQKILNLRIGFKSLTTQLWIIFNAIALSLNTICIYCT